MDNEILFTEKQRFNQWWLWLLALSINGLFIFGVFKQVIGGQQFGSKPMSDAGLLVVTVLINLLTIVTIGSRLDTHIKKDGIYVRFFPFHFRFKQYTWDTLTKAYVREYSAIAEYGGWGLRLGLFGNGTAYNVSGNKGLQIEFKTNKKLLIGTNKADEIAEILNRIGQIKH